MGNRDLRWLSAVPAYIWTPDGRYIPTTEAAMNTLVMIRDQRTAVSNHRLNGTSVCVLMITLLQDQSM
jgi:hypothetical protein